MKRILIFITLLLPVALHAQKLSDALAEDFSTRAAHQYQLKNDPAFLFVTEQLTRSGSGGLDIDKTMTELNKDPEALDAALKFLYQYSDCNRQQFIANLRAMQLQSNSVFPLATYTVNKFKGEAKTLQEEKATMVKMGTMPVAPPSAPAKSTEEETGQAVVTGDETPGQPATQTTAAAPQPAADTYDWEVRTLFKLRQPEQLEELYGKQNVVARSATDLQGNEAGQAYYVFPDTNNEMEVVFDGDNGTALTFTKENSKWKSPFGIKVGDPLSKVVKVNGKNFRINGFEWENGGTVDSWEGGAISGKGVAILFKALNTGDPKVYDKITGGKKLKTDMSALKEAEVVVEKIVFKSN